MKWHAPICIAALLAGCAAPAADDNSFFDVPQTQFKSFAKAPVIDGELDDQCWKDATRITSFHDNQTGADAKSQTTTLGGFDKDNLYIGFDCAEPKSAELAAGAKANATADCFATDHVEVFLKSDPASEAYYHFAVNTSGTVYEALGENGKWQAKWQAAVKIKDDRWLAEIAIPLKAINAKEARFLTANFCRTRKMTLKETSCWSPAFGSFHNPARFGSVTLGGQTALQTERCEITKTSDGSQTLSVKIIPSSENTVDAIACVMLKKGSAYVETAKSPFQLKPGQTTEISIPLKLEENYNGPVTLVIRDPLDTLICFRGPQDFSLTGTRGMRLAHILTDEAAPGIRWIETERIRGCCYGFKANPPAPFDMDQFKEMTFMNSTSRISLKRETIIRVFADAKEPIAFGFTGGDATSPFDKSTYAVYAPDGKFVSEGEAKPGETKEVKLQVAAAGAYLVWINSGPASGNAFSLRMDSRKWVVDGRGKGAYIDTVYATQNSVRDIALAGFNTLLLASWGWSVDFSTDDGLAKWLELISPWVEAAERNHIRLIPYVGWGCGREDIKAAGDYRKNMSLREIDGPRPCPLAEEYWERSFMHRALAVAQLSLKSRCVIGVGLDPESYTLGEWYKTEYGKRGLPPPSWGSITFINNDECFCDHCFNGFIESRNLAKPEALANGKARLEWLKSQKLVDDYYKYLEDGLAKLTRKLATRLQEVNPDFMVDVMLLGNNDVWWCRGASRGLGSPRVPVLDFDELTYTPGFTSKSVDHVERFKQWGANVVHGGAIWAGMHRPDAPGFLSSQLYHFAIRDSGYWFWPGNSSLWRNPDQLKHYYVLAGYQEDYWKSFVVANREIEAKLKGGDTYRSPLEALNRPDPPGRNLDNVKTANEWSLKPFYPIWPESGEKIAVFIPKGTKKLTVKWGLKGETGLWAITAASPKRQTGMQTRITSGNGDKATFNVEAGEDGAIWTIQATLKEEGRSGHIGIGVDGIPPFFGVIYDQNPIASKGRK